MASDVQSVSPLQALAANKILSAPVVSVPEDPYRAPGHVWPQELPLDAPSQLVGFVDVKDILASLLQGEGGRLVMTAQT
jgi:hypothetical protein